MGRQSFVMKLVKFESCAIISESNEQSLERSMSRSLTVKFTENPNSTTISQMQIWSCL